MIMIINDNNTSRIIPILIQIIFIFISVTKMATIVMTIIMATLIITKEH